MKFFKEFIVLMIIFRTCSSKTQSNWRFQLGINLASEVRRLATYKKPATDFGTCNFIYSENEPICLITFTSYMKTLFAARVIVKTTSDNNDTIPDFVQDTKTTETILFMDTVSKFNYTFQNFVSSEFFKNAGKYKIVFCGRDNITDDRVLYDMAKFVWSYGVLNFGFMYYHTKYLKEVQYNPFFDKLSIFRIKDISEDYEEYPDKLKNMNGYPLKVLDYPNLVESNNLYYDFDWNFRHSLKTTLNTTLTYHDISLDDSTSFQVKNEMINFDLDLCINTLATSGRYFPQRIRGNLEFSYPHMINHYVLLVPKPRKANKWTIMIFNSTKWTIPMLLLVCLLSAYFDKISSLDVRKFDIEFFIFSALNVPMSRCFSKKSIVKATWLISMLFMAILLGNGYLNILLVDKYKPGIKTIQDLKESGIKIYAADKVNLSYPYIPVSKSEWKTLLFKNDQNSAFIGPYMDINRIDKYFSHKHIEFKYEYFNKIVLPKFGSFAVKKKSPYLHKIGLLAAKVREFGVTTVTSKISNKVENLIEANIKMSFKDFVGLFIILWCGLTVALIAFILELCWYHYVSKYRFF